MSSIGNYLMLNVTPPCAQLMIADGLHAESVLTIQTGLPDERGKYKYPYTNDASSIVDMVLADVRIGSGGCVKAVVNGSASLHNIPLTMDGVLGVPRTGNRQIDCLQRHRIWFSSLLRFGTGVTDWWRGEVVSNEVKAMEGDYRLVHAPSKGNGMMQIAYVLIDAVR
jgi:hypothetical protein